MNITNLCQILLGTEQLIVEQIMVEEKRIDLFIESTASKAFCPKCQVESGAVHSRYNRYPVDLAWADRAVVFNLRVKRFFCRNQGCPKRTFAEQFPRRCAPICS